jgi:outer membrane receptor protein involved in Fe transport
MKNAVRLVAFVLSLLSCLCAVFPQSQISSADLKGKVVDSTGAVLPGATVTVTSVEKGTTRDTVTNERGEYLVPLLPPDQYTVKVDMPGFGAQTKKVTLTVGQTAIIDFTLGVAGTTEELTITAEAPLIETERASQSDVISEKPIMNLPINGREYLDFAKLTPGVTDTNPFDTSGLPQLPTSKSHFAGQSARGNSINIDGASNNEYAGNSVRATLSQEAIQEFQINRSNYSAEFGEASAGVINIVTKSGTNNVHGSLFYFLRDQKLDARNAFAFDTDGNAVNPPFSRQQWGGTLGGPIKRDKTFFFTSFERLDRAESHILAFLRDKSILRPTAQQQGLIDFLRAGAGAPDFGLTQDDFRSLAGLLDNTLTVSRASQPCRDLGGVERRSLFVLNVLCNDNGILPFKAQRSTFSTRIDHTFSTKNQITGRFNYTTDFTEAFRVSPDRTRSNGANNDVADVGFIITDTQIFSPNLVNEARFQFARRRFDSLPVDPIGPRYVVSGVGEFGHNFNIPSLRTERRYQWVDNLNVTKGNHRLKFGGDINLFKFASRTEIFFGGGFTFAQLTPLVQAYSNPPGIGITPEDRGRLARLNNYLQSQPQLAPLAGVFNTPITATQAFKLGLPVLYEQGFGDPNIAISVWTLGFYAQDSWKVRNNFSLDLGLRYDYELQPPPTPRDKNNFGPRFGFSWDPFNDRKTVIRGGYGISYSRLFQAITFISKVLSSDTGISQLRVVIFPATRTPDGRNINAADIFQSLRGDTSGSQPLIGTRRIAESDLQQRFGGLSRNATPERRAIFAVDPKIVNPYNHQASFGIERELTPTLSLAVNYLVNRGVKVLWLVDTNIIRSSGIDQFGVPQFLAAPGTRRTNVLQVHTAESSGSSIYHGMTVELNKRYSHHFQFLVAYTLGKAIGIGQDIFTDLEPANQLNKRGERAISTFDQRQRLVVSGVLESPFKAGPGNPIYSRIFSDITLAPIFSVGSGRPFNLELGFDYNRDGQDTDRPFFPRRPGTNDLAAIAARNSGLGPATVTFDLRLAKVLRFKADNPTRLEVMVEAFNLFNRVNFTGINNKVLFDPSNGFPALSLAGPGQGEYLTTFNVRGRRGVPPTAPLGFTQAADARQIQLGLRFSF